MESASLEVFRCVDTALSTNHKEDCGMINKLDLCKFTRADRIHPEVQKKLAVS